MPAIAARVPQLAGVWQGLFQDCRKRKSSQRASLLLVLLALKNNRRQTQATAMMKTVGQILVLALFGFLAVTWSFDSYISTGQRLFFITVTVIIPLAVYFLTRGASMRNGASGRVRLVWPLAIGFVLFIEALVPLWFLFLFFDLSGLQTGLPVRSYPFHVWGVSFGIAALTAWLLVRKVKW